MYHTPGVEMTVKEGDEVLIYVLLKRQNFETTVTSMAVDLASSLVIC